METKNMANDELKKALKLHALWVEFPGWGKKLELSGRSLGACDFSGADLSFADLSNADLRDANFSNAFLYNTNLTGARLNRAYMQGASMFEAKFTTELDGAFNVGSPDQQYSWTQEWFSKSK